MPKQKKPTTVAITVNADPETKARIEAAAERENRTVSNWVLTVIKERLMKEAHGDELAEALSQKLRALTKVRIGELEKITDAQWEALLDEGKRSAENLDTPKDDG